MLALGSVLQMSRGTFTPGNSERSLLPTPFLRARKLARYRKSGIAALAA